MSKHAFLNIIGRMITLVLGTCVIILGPLIFLNRVSPLPDVYPNGPSTVVISSDGQILRSFGDKQGVHRYLTDPDKVDAFYLQMLLHYEDRWFYYHPGINPIALLRAALQWLYHGEIISGGSTLTMQVARLIDPHPRSITGKFQQMWRALQLEWYFSKQEILTMYLNLAPYGGNIEGIEAATRRYFNKSANEINKNEAALLVVLPQKPSLYRPDRYPLTARAMRDKVLWRSVESDLLSGEEARLLVQEPVRLTHSKNQILAPLLSRQLKKKYPTKHVIETTLDFDIQSRLARLLSHRKGSLPDKTSAAVLVVNNRTSQVIGYQASVDFYDSSRFSHVNMIEAVRSPGSTLKPFIYGMAFDHGLIHSESLLSDIPTSFHGYKPRNLNGRYSGAVSVSTALKKSLNVPLIQVLNRVKVGEVDQQFLRAGVKLKHRQANLSIGLGGTGTTLWELAKMYRSLANRGQVGELTLLKNDSPSSDKALLSPQSSWVMFSILSSLSAPDRVIPEARRQIAWKTGTSYGYRDFWSIGVSPDFTVAVWVGRPDSGPLVGFLGATKAAPLMFDVFDLLPRDQHVIEQPDNIENTLICWPGGKAAQFTESKDCKLRKYAFTLQGITPPTMQSHGDFVTQDRWPDLLSTWQKRHKVMTGQESEASHLEIVSLRSGQHYFHSQLDRLPLTASVNSETIEWYINHEPYPQSELKLSDYLGETVITACLATQCDQKTIFVHH